MIEQKTDHISFRNHFKGWALGRICGLAAVISMAGFQLPTQDITFNNTLTDWMNGYVNI